MRLIDADALKLMYWVYSVNGMLNESDFRTAIDEQPTVDAVPVDELKNRDVKFYDNGKAFEVFFPIGLDLDTVNEVKIRGRKFVPVKSIEQLKWERDTAIQQLGEHGIPFCGKAEDVVTVVRCKDCKHYSRCTDHQGICTNRYMDGFILPDWFCADGERISK